MKKRDSNFFRYFRQSVGAMLITLIVCGLVKWAGLNSDVFNPIAEALDQIAFTDSYFTIENAESKQVDANMDVAFIDMSGCQSRGEIAAGLSRIAALNPRVVAMDCIFSDKVNADPAENDSLVSAIKRIPNFIAAQHIVDGPNGAVVNSSFFSPYCHNASVNIEDKMVRTFSPTEVSYADTTLPSFVGEVIRLGYPDKYETIKATMGDEELINYKRLQFDTYHITDAFDAFDIEDRILFIGDNADLLDYHAIPTELYGRRRICGTLIHIYALTTATKEGRFIDTMGEIPQMVWAFVLTMIFNFICCWILSDYKRIDGIIINFAQVAVLVLLLGVGYWAFHSFNFNVNHTLTMLGVGLSGFSSDLWLCIEETPAYQRMRAAVLRPFTSKKK